MSDFVIIENTADARVNDASLGYGYDEFQLTPEMLAALQAGKCLAVDEHGGEYVMFITLAGQPVPPHIGAEREQYLRLKGVGARCLFCNEPGTDENPLKPFRESRGRAGIAAHEVCFNAYENKTGLYETAPTPKCAIHGTLRVPLCAFCKRAWETPAP